MATTNVCPASTEPRAPTSPGPDKAAIRRGAMEQLEWALEQTMKINHRMEKEELSQKFIDSKEELAKRIDELRLDAGKVPGRPSSPVSTRRKVSFAADDQDKTEPSPTPKTSPERERPEQPSWDHLPLLNPGQTYKHSEISKGFRLFEGMVYTYDHNNTVTVMESDKDFSKNKIMPIAYEWEDGGVAWMYWSHSIVNKEGYTLPECMIRYGIGVGTDTERDFRSKCIYLDKDKQHKAGKCFILAMDRPKAGGRVLVKGSETNKEVVRIYRSSVPEDVQKVITLYELVKTREGDDRPSWWSMTIS